MPCSMLLFVGGFACGFLVLFLWALRQLPHAAQAIPPGHVVTMTVPTLPVEGEWLVVWGGPSAKQNAHHGVGVQHHALDLVKVGDDRTTHRGSGKANADYHCWGADIVAVQAGRVALVVTGIPDAPPGEMNQAMIYGNVVFIEHGDGRHSVYAHLMDGSPGVVVGDLVKAGHVIGRCGNSGNSIEPHLHFHMQTSATLERGDPVEVRFARVLVDGVVKTAHPPSKGEVVADTGEKGCRAASADN